jgi:hypothetical protein
MLRAILISSVLALTAASLAIVSAGSVMQANRGSELDFRLRAEAGTVAYYSNGKFHAACRERVHNGDLIQSFKVEVEGFTPDAEVPMRVNGTFVGNFYVNSLGRGEMQFKNIDDDPGNGLPLPGGFPRLHAGDTVSVGLFTATYN